MKTLHVVVLAAAVLTVTGDEFRSDYEFYESAQGWFKIHKTPTDWWLAELRCHYEGGVLASPLNEDIKDVLIRFIEQNEQVTSYGVHIGVHNSLNVAEYSSIERVSLFDMPVRYEGLFPENYVSTKYCMRMFYHGGLLLSNCTDALPYICYKKKEEQLTLTECGTIDRGYQLDNRTGHCYKFHNTAVTWSLAYLRCMAEGGYLAIINSADEVNALVDLFHKNPAETIVGATFNDGAYIGILDWYQNGSWRTVCGENLEDAGYAKWGPGEPNNQFHQGHYQHCGSMFRTGLLDDTFCDLPRAFICEKDPNSLRRKRHSEE